MRSQKLTLKTKLASLILLSTILGCASNKTVLYPITYKDICVKGQAECSQVSMDVCMSEFYLNKVLEAKIKK